MKTAHFAFPAIGLLLLCGCGGGGGSSVPAPTLTAIGPAQGPAGGGTTLTLTGTGFSGAVSVTVGGTAATGIAVVDDTTVTCGTPAGAPGLTVGVAVGTAGGTATLPDSFTYNPLPTLSRLSPDTGFSPGGFGLMLEGTGFVAHSAGPCTVTVGGSAASFVMVANDTMLFCTAPAGVVGQTDVSVSNANGSAALLDGFTYFGYPPSFPPTDVRLDTDVPGAASSLWPRIGCDGPGVFATWSDQRNGSGDIYFNRSVDGGATWLVDDVRLDTDVAGAGESRFLHITGDGSNVYVVWQDDRNGLDDIYFNRSTDGGATWMAEDVRLDTDVSGAAASVYPRLACVGTTVYAVWRDDRDGSWDIYLNRSTDAGATWLAEDVRLDTDAPGAASSVYHRVCSVGSNVYVTWYDYRNGANADVYFQRSTDEGASWLADDLRINTDAPAANHASRSEVGCDGENVYVVWLDARNGAADVYFNRSTDTGTTWLAGDVRLDTDAPGASECGWPLMACEGSNVCVAWDDDRNGATDVYLNRSTDAGATWLADDVRLDTDAAGASGSDGPMVCLDGPNVYVAWEDARNGALDVYFNVSDDGGASWLTDDVRLDTDAAGSGVSSTVQVCCNGARIYAVWADERNGAGDIYATASRP